jgi:hypothetical protein
MKIQFPVLSVILILFAKLAAAQIYPPQPGDFKLAVPFDFLAEKQTLPPGNYIVRREKASNKVQICEDGVTCETTETTAVHSAEPPTCPTLVFHHYGDKHSLSQIWFPDGTGLQLPICPLELEASRTEAKLEGVYVKADLLCIHMSKGLPPSWH